MTEKRLIVDDDYAWIDTFTNTVIEIEDALDLVNKLWKENEELKKIRDVAFEFAEEPTQHNLWKLRSFLKEYNSRR